MKNAQADSYIGGLGVGRLLRQRKLHEGCRGLQASLCPQESVNPVYF